MFGKFWKGRLVRRMEFKKARVISWLLILAMVIGMLPFGVWAQEPAAEQPAPPVETEQPTSPTVTEVPVDEGTAEPSEPVSETPTPEKAKTFSFTLKAQTSAGAPLEGAKYSLFAAEDAADMELTRLIGEEYAVDPTTGEIVFKDLPADTYRLEETTVPEGKQKTEDILFTIEKPDDINLLSPENPTEKVLLDAENNILTLISEDSPPSVSAPLPTPMEASSQNITLTTEVLNPKPINYTGETRIFAVTLEISDGESILSHPKLVISLPHEYIESINPSDLSGATKKTVARVGDNWVVTYDFNALAGGTYIQVPVTITTQKHITPDNYPLVISASLVKSDDTVAVEAAPLTITYDTVDFNLRKSVVAGNDMYHGKTSARPFAGVATPDAPNTVPMDTQTYVAYQFHMTGTTNGGLSNTIGARSIEEVTVTDQLPAAAVFDQEKNPDWTYDAATHTASTTKAINSYVMYGIHYSTTTPLYLRFPGADADIYHANTASLTVVPQNAQPYEDFLKPEAVRTSTVEHRLAVAVPPVPLLRKSLRLLQTKWKQNLGSLNGPYC